MTGPATVRGSHGPSRAVVRPQAARSVSGAPAGAGATGNAQRPAQGLVGNEPPQGGAIRTARLLLLLHAEGTLTTRALRDGLWSELVWPWTPPGHEVTSDYPLADAVTDWRAALDVHLLVALEALEAALSAAGTVGCHRDAEGRVCLVCDRAQTARDAALDAAAAAVVRDVPQAAARGLVV